MKIYRHKRVFASNSNSNNINEVVKRKNFAEKLIEDLENDYNVSISNEAYGDIMDLADDLNYGKDANRHGSTPYLVLEDAIYEIFEEDTGIQI